MKEQPYRRVLLKLSGESILGDVGVGIDNKVLQRYAKEIKQLYDCGIELGIVIGGGNIFRGVQGSIIGMDRVQSDYMGMLATVINCMALQEVLVRLDMPTRLVSAIRVESIAEPFIRDKAIHHLEQKRIVLFAAGTGNPYFTTDTAAALRAQEVNADVILKGTHVDGIYDSDPKKNMNAKKIDRLSGDEAINKRYNVMDITAFTLCRDSKIPIIVFDMNVQNNLKKIIIDGEKIGSEIFWE